MTSSWASGTFASPTEQNSSTSFTVVASVNNSHRNHYEMMNFQESLIAPHPDEPIDNDVVPTVETASCYTSSSCHHVPSTTAYDHLHYRECERSLRLPDMSNTVSNNPASSPTVNQSSVVPHSSSESRSSTNTRGGTKRHHSSAAATTPPTFPRRRRKSSTTSSVSTPTAVAPPHHQNTVELGVSWHGQLHGWLANWFKDGIMRSKIFPAQQLGIDGSLKQAQEFLQALPSDCSSSSLPVSPSTQSNRRFEKNANHTSRNTLSCYSHSHHNSKEVDLEGGLQLLMYLLSSSKTKSDNYKVIDESSVGPSQSTMIMSLQQHQCANNSNNSTSSSSTTTITGNAGEAIGRNRHHNQDNVLIRSQDKRRKRDVCPLPLHSHCQGGEDKHMHNETTSSSCIGTSPRCPSSPVGGSSTFPHTCFSTDSNTFLSPRDSGTSTAPSTSPFSLGLDTLSPATANIVGEAPPNYAASYYHHSSSPKGIVSLPPIPTTPTCNTSHATSSQQGLMLRLLTTTEQSSARAVVNESGVPLDLVNSKLPIYNSYQQQQTHRQPSPVGALLSSSSFNSNNKGGGTSFFNNNNNCTNNTTTTQFPAAKWATSNWCDNHTDFGYNWAEGQNNSMDFFQDWIGP